MDILSDVKITGNLAVSNWIESGNQIGAKHLVSPTANISEFSAPTKFRNSVSFNSNVDLYRYTHFYRYGIYGMDQSHYFYDWISISPEEILIEVPANCERFLIRKYGANSTDAVFSDNIAVHPLVTAWCGRKKVELDYEIVGNTCGQGYSEFLIGEITPSLETRNITVVVY